MDEHPERDPPLKQQHAELFRDGEPVHLHPNRWILCPFTNDNSRNPERAHDTGHGSAESIGSRFGTKGLRAESGRHAAE